MYHNLSAWQFLKAMGVALFSGHFPPPTWPRNEASVVQLAWIPDPSEYARQVWGPDCSVVQQHGVCGVCLPCRKLVISAVNEHQLLEFLQQHLLYDQSCSSLQLSVQVVQVVPQCQQGFHCYYKWQQQKVPDHQMHLHGSVQIQVSSMLSNCSVKKMQGQGIAFKLTFDLLL